MYFAFQENQFPGYAEIMAGDQALQQAEASFEDPLDAGFGHYVTMSGFYIQHNTGIGLRCFAWGILIIPCLYVLASNAIQLGAVFGYMARSETSSGDHFFEFVTAHGPCELTAIALAAGAGLRLGVGLFCYRRINAIGFGERECFPRRAHYVRLGNAIRASCFYRGISIALACSLRHQGHVGDLLFGID